MIAIPRFVTFSVASALALAIALPGAAQEADLDDLFDNLRDVGPEAAQAIEGRIWAEWSKSGSPTLDLLLDRGREALEAEEPALAVEHMTALIDHAPDFAEAYNVRATAYFQQGLFGPSLEDIRMTLALNPRHFAAMSGLGLILEELGYTEEALAAWREVVAIHPHQQGAVEAIERLEREVEGQTL
ncbi:MAG: tetratricopeptide repeat protein [Paracoccaceae bacterium]|nr:tetratricopeptide repeat protein [Paracoccaceae bacterium]